MLKKTLLVVTPNGEEPGIYNPALSSLVGKGEGIDIINLLLGNIIAILLIAGVIAAFIFIIIGAIQWMTAGNDKTQMESARGKIVGAIIGLVILFSVFAIMKLIGTFFGIEQLKQLFFDISPYLISD